jgi:leucine dehydrogenase
MTNTTRLPQTPEYDGHEQVVFCKDESGQTRAIIAIHSTALGPALGGCRMWPYPSESEALDDVLRLSRAMTYKHAVAGSPHGGGKAVLLGDPCRDKNESLWRTLARSINELGGRYITADDVGTTAQDMIAVREWTPHVVGLPPEKGGSGDGWPMTAYGVYCGILAAVAYRRLGRQLDYDGLAGITVAVQGLGHVGHALCRHLHEAGARLIVADVRRPAVERACRDFDAQEAAPEEIYDAEADVFAPCALGGTLNSHTVPRLRVAVVAGSANNQLSSPGVGRLLHQRGILYAPDYVINAGGVINVCLEGPNYDEILARERTRGIGRTLTEIFTRADREGRTTEEVADELARERLT